MKRKLISFVLILSMIMPSFGVTASAAQSTYEPDLFNDIFNGIADVDADAKAEDLPYLDGTILSDVREPLALQDGTAKLFGEADTADEGLEWGDLGTFNLKSSFTVNNTSYSVVSEFKILASYEGDFNGDGKQGEIAAVTAAKTTDGNSLLLLCTAEVKNGATLSPMAVLYSGTADFYDDTLEFANCIDVVCADVNGDGYDEIVTTTPTSGIYANQCGDYGFDNHAVAVIWYLDSETITQTSWEDPSEWCDAPYDTQAAMPTFYPDCYLGAPGTTATLAAGDVDGDGYDDLVVALSTTKCEYNSTYSGNMFYVYYVGGAPTFKETYDKRKLLTPFLPSELKNDLSIGLTSGDVAGFDVAICDVDNSGKPTIFLSMKQTWHYYVGFNGDKMLTPSFAVVALDYKKTDSDFTFIGSTVLHKGIYHNGYLDLSNPGSSDFDYVYRTKPTDCAPVRIGVLKGDYGLSDDKTGYVSSGTLVADRRLYSFVRYADGNTYRYEIQNNGLFTGDIGDVISKTAWDYEGDDCVFYGDGINVTDIRTASVSFDGQTYTDAALVKAYTDSGFRTYFVNQSGNGYTASTLNNDRTYASIAMPDTDSDSIRLQYNKHVFFWSDPVIIAALASPPYFDSLPSDAYTNSQTTYGKSITTSTGKTESYTVSAGAYISSEIKAGAGGVSAVFETEWEKTYSDSESIENTVEVSFGQSFSASGGEDTVVLSTVGYDAYAYTAYYPGPDGGTAESPYVVFVPRGGSDAIKIAALNYEEYLEFVPYAEGVLPDLSDVFTHTVGKPETYPSDSSTGANVLYGSTIVHPNLSSFPSNEGCNTLSIDITDEVSQTTSSGTSVSAKLGGGIEAEAEDIFGMASAGAKTTAGGVSEKEYECGTIKTSAVGTSFEGAVFGQGDGMNVSGSGEKKAYFNWKLLHYIYDFGEKNDKQQFPVITYITSGVVQPEGVVPTSVTVSPSKRTIEQVGPATKGYVNEASFTITAAGVTREAYTALEGAPTGMTLNTGDSGIATSNPFAFGVKINGNVQPGEYELRLNVGGVLSDPFTVTVREYQAPHWIEADTAEIDFGSTRYNYYRGTPAAEEQTVTISNIHTEQISDLTAELDENSAFEISTPLSPSSLYAKDLTNSTATIGIKPKERLDVGEHTGTLTVTNGVTATFVTLKYTVTNPTLPQAPTLERINNGQYKPNPVNISYSGPSDDGGGQMLYYLYTILGHENYMDENGEQTWATLNSTIQSGVMSSFTLPNTLTVGEEYTVGMKAVTTVGESEAAWLDFEVSEAENPPDPPKNVQTYVCDGTIAVTWEDPGYWGENKYVPVIQSKWYNIYLTDKDNNTKLETVSYGDELRCAFTDLNNGEEYTVEVYARNENRYNSVSAKATPSAETTSVAFSPSNFKASMEYKKATLTWEAPVFNGGADITAYKLSKDGGDTWIDLDASTTEYIFEELVTNQEYEFKVCAVNSVGVSEPATLTATPPSSLGTPTINSVIRGNGQLELEWMPTDNDNVIGYQVRIDDGEWQETTPIKFDGTLRHIFTGLENDKYYTLSVCYVDAEGRGPAATMQRKPSSLAPLGPQNARVEPKNGGFQIFGDVESGVYLEYKVDNGWMWWSSHSGAEITGYDNGTTYIVGLSTSGSDENGLTLRTTSYFEVTPDASLPLKPSAPEIKAVVNGDDVHLEWQTEDNGFAIQSYTLSYDDTQLSLPAEVTSIDFNMREIGLQYPRFRVKAINSGGESTGSIYIYKYSLKGDLTFALAEDYGSAYTSQFSVVQVYTYEDDEGNMYYDEYDVSDSITAWSIDSPSDKITWDADNRQILIANGLTAGVYDVKVIAEYYELTYEYDVRVSVGVDVPVIISAEKSADKVNVKLSLPESLGSVVMCVASYDEDGRLTNSAFETVSSQSLTNGEIEVSLTTDSEVKVMLFDTIESLKPLCESKTAS